jgi:hypothetical protein
MAFPPVEYKNSVARNDIGARILFQSFVGIIKAGVPKSFGSCGLKELKRSERGWEKNKYEFGKTL